MQQKILQAIHASATGGHSGMQFTHERLRRLFAWAGMRQDVNLFVSNCNICKQAKAERVRTPGLLEPLPIPPHAWHTVTLDFVEGLPISRGFSCIMVVVDKLTRYAHFIPLAHPFSALQVATTFMTHVYKLHGLPHAMVSDRDRVFTSRLWKELFCQAGTELRMSSAYHPQTDGTTERVNQCLETYLRCFVHSCPHRWFQWLHLAEFWYNTAPHSALQASPFEVLYGHPPRHFGIIDASVSSPMDLASWHQEREVVTALLRQHLERSRQRMKDQADRKRSERSFSVGDWVFVKLQPYVQVSVAARANHKLSFKFFGPFQVTARIGEVAYRLKMPEGSRIHPVFHVSLLRQALPPDTEAVSALPEPLPPHSPPDFPEKVLARRMITRGKAKIPQVLIKWSSQPDALASWEDFFELRSRFPGAAAWGQAASEARGDVTDTATPKPTNDAGRPKRNKKPNRLFDPDTWEL
ncbi:hypothetical protein VPH35_108289 [Triticum aestivum]